jgi:VWFA-related protein
MGIDRKFIALLTGLLLILLPFSYLFSENKKKKTVAKNSPAFGVAVDVVVVNATVTDKDGNPITDLTANDFKVYEDSKPQEIQTFTLESYGAAVSQEKKPKSAAFKDTKANRNLTRQNAPQPRLITIFIDDLTMYSPSDLPLLIKSIKKFVAEGLGPMDQLAILSASGRVKFPFSNNKQQLSDGLSVAYQDMNYLPIVRSDCPQLTDLQAARLSDGTSSWDVIYKDLVKKAQACLNTPYVEAGRSYLIGKAKGQNAIVEYQIRSFLQTLRQHIRALRHFEGAKTVMIFSDGFLAENSSPIVYPLQEIVDLALRSGIALNTTNIQGAATFIDASEGLGKVGDFPNPSDSAKMASNPVLYAQEMQQEFDQKMSANAIADRERDSLEDMRAKQDPLIQIARDTGGLYNANLRNILNRRDYSYVISYGMPAHKTSGRYHKIRLEVTRPGLKLSYRKGYYTLKEELSYVNSKREDIMEALHGPGNMNQIPIALSYNYFQESDSSYSVSFLTDVNVRNVKFLEEDGRRTNQVSLVLAAYDETDHYIDGIEKVIDFRLLESSHEAMRKSGLASRVELKLPIGRYKIKAVVREGAQGKVGSVTKAVEIP